MVDRMAPLEDSYQLKKEVRGDRESQRLDPGINIKQPQTKADSYSFQQGFPG
jgi:hypothetical protein